MEETMKLLDQMIKAGVDADIVKYCKSVQNSYTCGMRQKGLKFDEMILAWNLNHGIVSPKQMVSVELNEHEGLPKFVFEHRVHSALP
ncbi:hypothetical protein RJ641_032279, partial [Dillenia turbinata]